MILPYLLLFFWLFWILPSSTSRGQSTIPISRKCLYPNLTLRDTLVTATELDGFSLALAPGFFRYYAILGAVHAIDDVNLLKTFSLSGSSAGALIASFLATGQKPSEIVEPILALDRKDIWDLGGRRFLLGLLKGQKFDSLLEKYLPVSLIEDCPIAFGCTVYDIMKRETLSLTKGPITTAVRTSCSFPLLFQPVRVKERRFCIDGAIEDKSGLRALPKYPPQSKLIVNIMFGRDGFEYSTLPKQFHDTDAELLTVVIEGVPNASPLSMKTIGPIAYAQAKRTVNHYLQASFSNQANLTKKSDRHHYVILNAID